MALCLVVLSFGYLSIKSLYLNIFKKSVSINVYFLEICIDARAIRYRRTDGPTPL